MADIVKLNGYTIKDKNAIHSEDIIDNLESEETTKTLSAKQGKILKETKIQVTENVNDQTSIYSKFKNVSLKVDYYNNTTLYDIELNNINSLKLQLTGNTTNPLTTSTNVYDYAQENTSEDLIINGGLFNQSTLDTIGHTVYNGTSYSGSGTPDFYVGFDEDNNLMATNSSDISSASDLVELGYKNACGSFAPLILNGTVYDVSSLVDDTYTSKEPRQIIYQTNDNKIHILSVLGRNPFNQGLTYSDITDYLQNKNVKIAVNLDGGGSVQTVYNRKLLFESQDPSRRDGRTISNVFTIQLGGDF